MRISALTVALFAAGSLARPLNNQLEDHVSLLTSDTKRSLDKHPDDDNKALSFPINKRNPSSNDPGARQFYDEGTGNLGEWFDQVLQDDASRAGAQKASNGRPKQSKNGVDTEPKEKSGTGNVGSSTGTRKENGYFGIHF